MAPKSLNDLMPVSLGSTTTTTPHTYSDVAIGTEQFVSCAILVHTGTTQLHQFSTAFNVKRKPGGTVVRALKGFIDCEGQTCSECLVSETDIGIVHSLLDLSEALDVEPPTRLH